MSDFKPQGGEEQIHENPAIEHYSVRPKDASTPFEEDGGSASSRQGHGAVELVDSSTDAAGQPPIQTTVAELDRSKGRFGYLKKRQFWIVLLLSQALAVTITGTNTLSSLLRDEGTSIPAFQSLFNVSLELLFSIADIDSSCAVHPIESHLYFLDHLQVWLQRLAQSLLEGRLAILHPSILRC